MYHINLSVFDDGHGGLLADNVKTGDGATFSMKQTCFEYLASQFVKSVPFKEMALGIVASKNQVVFSDEPNENSEDITVMTKETFTKTYQPQIIKQEAELVEQLQTGFDAIWNRVSANPRITTFFGTEHFRILYDNSEVTNSEGFHTFELLGFTTEPDVLYIDSVLLWNDEGTSAFV